MKTKRLLIPSMLLGLALCACAQKAPEASSSNGGEASSEKEPSSSLGSGSGGEDSSSISSSSPASFEDPVELEEKVESKAYIGALNDAISLPTYFFTFAEDVPYVDAGAFFCSFWNEVYSASVYFESGDAVVNSLNGASCHFLASENKILFSDYDLFLSPSSLPIPFDVLSAEEDPLAHFDSEHSSFSSAGQFYFDLAPYQARLVEFEGRVYAPFAYLETIGFASSGNRFAFNGDDYYYVEDGALYSGSQLTPYGRAYYSGSLSSQRYRSFDYSEYFYYSFLFEMEHFYGKFDELGIVDLDAKLDELGLKEQLFSETSSVADSALAATISTLFGDGGHTAFLHRGAGVSYSQRVDYELQSQILSSDYRYFQKYRRYSELSRLRGGLVPYETSGSTAVIRFDSFELNPFGQSPSKDDVSRDSYSTFALFYNSFRRIQSDPDIENVVFDVSLNGGGYAMALGQALSFLTEDPVELHIHNPLTGADFTEAVAYDNDFDGRVEDDSYAGQYNFFILTSSYSFSCANAFPCMAKEMGVAKIIGERSGGGDCSVGAGIASDGAYWQMSSNQKLVHEDGSSFDLGAQIDIALPDDCFYDASKLNLALAGE